MIVVKVGGVTARRRLVPRGWAGQGCWGQLTFGMARWLRSAGRSSWRCKTVVRCASRQDAQMQARASHEEGGSYSGRWSRSGFAVLKSRLQGRTQELEDLQGACDAEPSKKGLEAAALVAEIERLRRDGVQLAESRKALKRDADAARLEAARLQKLCDAQAAELQELQRALGFQTVELASAQAGEAAAKGAELAAERAAADQARADVQAAREWAKGVQERVRQSDDGVSQLSRARTAFTQLQGQLEAAHVNIGHLQARMQQLEEDVGAARAEAAQRTGELAAAKKSLEGHYSHADRLEETQAAMLAVLQQSPEILREESVASEPEKVPGQGTRARVLESVPHGEAVAVKVADGDFEEQTALVREFAYLRRLRKCAGVVKVLSTVVDDGDSTGFIMPLASGTLTERLANVEKGSLAHMELLLDAAEQTGETLLELASKLYGHLDVKADNILWDESMGRFCLADSGVSRRKNIKRCIVMEDVTGTLGLQCPAMIAALMDGPAYINGCAADTYSWGVTLREGLTGVDACNIMDPKDALGHDEDAFHAAAVHTSMKVTQEHLDAVPFVLEAQLAHVINGAVAPTLDERPALAGLLAAVRSIRTSGAAGDLGNSCADTFGDPPDLEIELAEEWGGGGQSDDSGGQSSEEGNGGGESENSNGDEPGDEADGGGASEDDSGEFDDLEEG
ncbi:hypothetical protein WJX81_002542 [Elliptochloris bilobata]|uniref:Protein kinase domain-containing protein n=1 Tax=Elliptochloris bilobata TaxID=381761 RepID=A0AAW1RY21_9CHLO